MTAPGIPALEVLVCGRHSNFSDDIESACSLCSRRIFLRPHAKDVAFRLCPSCGRQMMHNHATLDDVDIPRQTMQEVKIKTTS
jgi:predicted RNA-binding Zn-ribbon protein involved in translation (DUF1610 family)